jgi:uncharacterized membrane protein
MLFLAAVVVIVFGFALLSKVVDMDRRLMALESKFPKIASEQNAVQQSTLQQNEAQQSASQPNASPQTSIQSGVVHHDVSQHLASHQSSSQESKSLSSFGEAVIMTEHVVGQDAAPQVSLQSAPNAQTSQLEQTSPYAQPTPSKTTEFELGSKVITAIGILAVVLGAGFFLRYAFETGLISVGMRIFLGFLAGIVMIVIGHVLKDKYDAYGTGLIGGGLALWYVTAYASYAFYKVIGEPGAFMLFLLISAFGIVMSVVYNSLPLIRFSLLGAFLVPFIFPFVSSVHILFPYLIILTLAVLLIARFKVWPDLTAFALVFSSLLIFDWTLAVEGEQGVVTFVYLSMIFVLYFTTSLINFVVRDRDYKGVDAFLVYALPTLYFLWSAPVIETRDGYALLTFAIGIFYIFASLAFRTVLKEFKDMWICSNMMITIGFIFLAASTAIHFDGTILAILLSVEALLMVVIGRMLGARINRLTGLAVSVVAFFVTMFSVMENSLSSADYTLIFNNNTFTYGMAILMYAGIWTVYKYFAPVDGDKDETAFGLGLGAIGISLMTLFWMTGEILNYVDVNPFRYLPLFWSLYGLIMVTVSFAVKDKVFRGFGIASMFAAFAMMIFTSWFDYSHEFKSVFNLRFLSAITLVFSMVVSVIIYKENKEELSENDTSVVGMLYGIINFTALWALSLEVIGYFDSLIQGLRTGPAFADSDIKKIGGYENAKKVALSMMWLVYSISALSIGIAKKAMWVRRFAIALLTVTIFKIFIVDTSGLSDVYRFISFMTLGVILLVVGYSYYRFKDRIDI